MSPATISEPFLLSSYATSHRIQNPKSAKKPQTAPQNLYATYEKASGSSDGYVTVAAQADGVHVLDLANLHPVISHSLGPLTTFPCPAVTRNTSSGAGNVCTTYAVIGSSDLDTPGEAGQRLWMWRDDLSNTLADRASQKKKSIAVPHPISGVYICDELPQRVLVLSPSGHVTITDAELGIRSTRTVPEDEFGVFRVFVFSRKSCSFLPSQTAPPTGAVLVLFTASGDNTHIRVLSVDEEDAVLDLGVSEIPFKRDNILDVSCSPSGYLSVLGDSWSSFQLESPDATTLSLAPSAEPIHLTGISHPSLLSLNTSHVLLSGISTAPTREILLLLWDLQYAVLLASHTLPIPSTLPQSTKEAPIRPCLVSASAGSQALLVLSPPSPSPTSKATPSSSPSRSIVLVVPFTVPAASTIANAMGRAAAGAKWVVGDGTSDSSPAYDAPRAELIKAMRAAIEQNRPQAATTAFFKWEKGEKAKTAAAGGDSEEQLLGYAFVKDILNMVLQPLNHTNIPYSSGVVRYLLEHKMVSGGMVVGGLLGALRLRNDWKSAEMALDDRNVLDISEAELMETLQLIVASHRKSISAAGDMQVDAGAVSDVPSLPAFLALCIRYPTSPPALRLAIRDHLRDVDDTMVVLRVLEAWIKECTQRDAKLLPRKGDVATATEDLPPLKNLLAFLQTLLDASFITLLQHPPSHKLFRALASHLEPEIAFIDETEQLRGPLEPFMRAHTQSTRDAAAASDGKRKEPQEDWRQRRKRMHEQSTSIGLYRLEELVL